MNVMGLCHEIPLSGLSSEKPVYSPMSKYPRNSAGAELCRYYLIDTFKLPSELALNSTGLLGIRKREVSRNFAILHVQNSELSTFAIVVFFRVQFDPQVCWYFRKHLHFMYNDHTSLLYPLPALLYTFTSMFMSVSYSISISIAMSTST
jgi:hypothetical protein